MILEKIFLPGESPDGFKPYFETYLQDDGITHGAVIVLPGGGYAGRADYEGEPVANRFTTFGFHAFTLQYRVKPAVYPAPMEDVFHTIEFLRSHAVEWRIKPDKIALLGFSAGGHLACSAGILWKKPQERPDATILCYPVISGVTKPNLGSFSNLLNGDTARYPEFSWELRVQPDTPPSFIWHTAADKSVPVLNSLRYAEVLQDKGIPFELHVFPRGEHGLALGRNTAIPEVQVWPELCRVWLCNSGW